MLIKNNGVFMSTKIYIGNLSFSTTEQTLQNLFSQYGKVISVKIIFDKITNQSKGFGFVEMENQEEAEVAIATINGKSLDNRRLRVKKATENKNESSNFFNPRF